MQPQDPGLVSVPGIDTPHYFERLTNFLFGNADNIIPFLQSTIGVITAICIPLSIFLLISIVITVENIKKLRALEEKRYNEPPEPEAEGVKEDAANKEFAARWKKVVEHVDSQNPNDWKQAIIEADVMLDQLVTKLGYRGESLGEKLKRTVRGDFKTRDLAWDAHMVRNRIAHDGSAFELNQVEAKRVVNMYRQVFEEFYHISG